MTYRSLKCSFCKRREQDVAKLVAGPRVYICDRCVAIAVDLMNAPDGPSRTDVQHRGGLLRRFVDGVRWLTGARQASLGEGVATW